MCCVSVCTPLLHSMYGTQIDPAVGANAVVAILLPTAGERLDVVLKCVLGASSQRSWPSSNAAKTGRGDGLRVIVLDEKRRKVNVYHTITVLDLFSRTAVLLCEWPGGYISWKAFFLSWAELENMKYHHRDIRRNV